MKPKKHALPTDMPAVQSSIAYLQDELNSRNAEIDRLLAQLTKLRQLYFGGSSEKADRQVGEKNGAHLLTLMNPCFNSVLFLVFSIL
ncbi:hypothetical protein Bresa_03234|uniref:Transposase IS166 family protein n=1 Tax=Brenneria salicis ATCC 15712 = DSM 30166 TaxID=714314 RepID=A0A366I2L8_9GAMM|nr:hypothetical protein [Brenneria salicis ATCC 15712 = DSM 30166]RBP60999.1 hypothetical protein DES54_12851 [Brenneria salicis ATCC 15712 = DSM 30166]RLM29739.1 hypothetical protein BHG07_14365 [Brenneria salicis ATCC 15712 = DSM 30166]